MVLKVHKFVAFLSQEHSSMYPRPERPNGAKDEVNARVQQQNGAKTLEYSNIELFAHLWIVCEWRIRKCHQFDLQLAAYKF